MSSSWDEALDPLTDAISDILSIRSSVCIHKKKFAALCQSLDNFRMSLMHVDLLEKAQSARDSTILKNLVESLTDIEAYFQGFTAESAIASLCTRSISETNEKLREFATKFNESVIALNLSEISPIPNLDTESEVIAHSADLEDIQERIQQFLDNHQAFSDADLLKKRLAEIDSAKEAIAELERSQRQHEDDQRRIMSQSEIEAKLAPFSKWFLRRSDFKQQRLVGSGGYASVYVGYQKSTKRVVAIKKLHAQKFSVAEFELFRREIEILSQMDHFAILPFVGVCISPPFLIMTEFMSGGCLFDWLRQPAPRLDPTQLTIIALGVACGMAYLHSKQLLHRDIKSMNILLDADGFPKICDFGMSRWKSQVNSNTHTRGVGTPQWMAPEVLNQQPYNEKADVYSYGILLWEMLSRQVPFGRMADLRMMFAVVHGSRPLIPQDAPPKLAKLIERCWSKDPEERPDFPTIVRAFSSGEMAFPGANHEMVMAYLSKNGESIVKDVLSDVTPGSILNDLKSKPEEGIAKLRLINGKEEWKDFLESSELIETLINLVNRCDNAQFADGVIQAVSDVIKLPESFQKFVDWNGPNAVLKLILKFATTTMASVIDFMTVLTQAKVVVFDERYLMKIAAFLLANGIPTRIATVTVVMQIVSTKSYENGRDMNVFLPNLLANLLPETMTELLAQVLRLLQVLIDVEGINFHDITEALVVLLKGQALSSKADQPVCDSCLSLLNTILVREPASPEVVSRLLELFVPLVDCGYARDSLKILAHLAKSFSAVSELTAFPGVVHCLFRLIDSEDVAVLICTLKLAYMFLENPVTFSVFEPKVKDILDTFLVHDNISVSFLAAAMAIVYIEKTKVMVCAELIVTFLKQRLSTKGELTVMALRLAGTISSFVSGAMRLEQEGIYELVVPFLRSDNDKERELAYLILAAASSNFPLSQAMIEAIPAFLDVCCHGTTDVCLVFLANVALTEKGALQCAPKLSQMIDLLLTSPPDDQFRILTLIDRIVAVGKCCAAIDTSEILQKLVTATRTMWQSEHNYLVFKLYEHISNFESGNQAISESGFKEFVLENLDKYPKSQQACLFQLFSRLA